MNKSGTDVFESQYAYDIFLDRYSLDRQETWADTCKRVVSNVCGQYLDSETQQELYDLMYKRWFIPAGRYLYAAGRPYHMICNCFAFRAEDSREAWGDTLNKATVTLSSGGGVGIDYSALRGEGAPIRRTGGKSSGPIALIHAVNEVGRFIRQGGNRRSAIWAGLAWNHPDVFKFMDLKNLDPRYIELKKADINFPVPMEGTNISVIYDTDFFVAIEDKKHEKYKLAKQVWEKNCSQAFSTAEPGMSFNFLKDNESLRNACTEFTSENDSDRCNLGSVWINRIPSREEFAKAISLATKFLICGGMYTDSPTEKIKQVGERNNKIGLGIGGVHEWLIANNFDYEVTPELHKWLRVYEQESDAAAYIFSKELGVNIPQKKRAMAPNGTIGCIAESTTSLEPLFCKAYKRRYFNDGKWLYQYVVDGAVKRLLDKGVKLEQIKDAYDIDFKARVKFQADFQNYVDMSISSTCNMPSWGSEQNNESNVADKAKTLLKYAKRLRGFTCYPDGCRSGQPLERCDLQEALNMEGLKFEETEERCIGGVCGV